MDDKILNIINAFNLAHVKCDVWIKIEFSVEYSTCPVEDSTSYGKPFWTKAVENFLGRSRIFSDGREFSWTVENFLGRSRIFSDDRKFSRTVENFLGRSRIFSDDREFSRTVENFLGRSRFFTDGRDFSRTVEIFLGRSRFFSDGREFSRTVEILNFSRSVEIFPRTLQLFLQFDYVAEK